MEIPSFKDEDEERDFWATHDSIDFLEGAEQVNLEYVGKKHEFGLVKNITGTSDKFVYCPILKGNKEK